MKQTNNEDILTHPIYGTLIALFVCWFFLYQVLGVWIATNLVGFFQKEILEKFYIPLVKSLVHSLPPILAEVLAGDYGILTLTVTSLFGILLPLVWSFYFIWSLLEESGYLSHLAVLTDGLFRKIGLTGRGIIPLILGFSCTTMAMMTLKMLSNKREQLILMILLGITIPCSVQLAVIQGLLTRIGGFAGWLIWLSVLIFVMFSSAFIANKLIPGESIPLSISSSKLKFPKIFDLLKKTNVNSLHFLEEAGLAFLIISLVVSFLSISGTLNYIINFFEPLISGILHLPKEASLSFLLGMIRREFGIFGLLNIPFTKIQAITACVSLSLFVPCIATLSVMAKERGLQIALAIWISSCLISFSIGGILTRILEFAYK